MCTNFILREGDGLKGGGGKRDFVWTGGENTENLESGKYFFQITRNNYNFKWFFRSCVRGIKTTYWIWGSYVELSEQFIASIFRVRSTQQTQLSFFRLALRTWRRGMQSSGLSLNVCHITLHHIQEAESNCTSVLSSYVICIIHKIGLFFVW